MLLSKALQAFVLPGTGVFMTAPDRALRGKKVGVLQPAGSVCLASFAALLPLWELRQRWRSPGDWHNELRQIKGVGL